MATKRPAGKRATRKPGTVKSRKISGKRSKNAAQILERIDSSYEEAIIKHILQSSPQVGKVPQEALIMGSLLSSMTPSTRELYYKSGMQAGRTLYKLNAAQKNYIIPEEAVEDLVAFFEKIGYSNVTYSAYLGGKTTMEFHGSKNHAHLGSKMHVFESGIISGFLTAARGQLVNITESSCIGANGETCRFSEVRSSENTMGNENAGSLDELAEIVKQKSLLPAMESGVSKEYQSLVYTPLLDKTYSEYMKSIASYMGGEVGNRIASAVGKRNGKKTLQSIEQAIKVLNMGTPTVKSIKPLDMRINFDELSSKQGFVDISVSFINGLLSSSLSGKATATENVCDGRYVVDIRGAK